MSETLSHKFVAALELPRDELYGIALIMEGTPQKAEVRIREVARELFEKFVNNPSMEVAAVFRLSLGAGAVEKASQNVTQNPSETVPKVTQSASETAPKPIEKYAMPADVWARLAASVQVEAAKSTATKALNTDSVLLSPDPLLAPRKSAPPGPADGLDLPASSRFLLASGVVIVIGILLTIYIVTRPVAPRPSLPSMTTTINATNATGATGTTMGAPSTGATSGPTTTQGAR